MKKKIQKKLFIFLENNILIRGEKLSLSRREHLPSALSVLGNSFEILHVTNTDFL